MEEEEKNEKTVRQIDSFMGAVGASYVGGAGVG
jgi:hypothetical protein